MNTFFKVLLIVLLTAIAIKLMPFFLFPFVVIGSALLAVVGLVLGGIATVAGVAVAVVAALLAVILALAALLSPIWIPILIIVGLIALVRRSNRVAA